MEVTLLGAGDTTGTPTIGCSCDTCERARERSVERSRFSVHVRNDRIDESVLIDASPDLRYQFLKQEVDLPDAAVISHIHFDHLDGLGNTYRVLRELPVYATSETDPKTGESVAETVGRKYDYLDALSVHPAEPFEAVEICGLSVRLVPVTHPPLVCYGVAIEDPNTGGKLSITGDTSYDVPEESREALAGPDLCFAEALVPASLCEHHPLGGDHHDESGVPRTFGTKHMTREGALSLAEELGASETRLVHAAHFYPAEEAFEEPLALDGEQYTL